MAIFLLMWGHRTNFKEKKLGEVILVLVVTWENKVNSEPDLFKSVQVQSGWVPSRVGV